MTEAAPAADDADKKPDQTAIELTADTLGADLMAQLIEEFDRWPGAWSEMQQHQQEAAIRRLETRVRKLITDALNVILRGDFPACSAVVESIQFKDGIKAVMKIARTEHHRYELTEHVGAPVVLVLHDPTQYFDRMDGIHSGKGQQNLPLAPTAADGPPVGSLTGPHVFDDPEHTGKCTRCDKAAEDHPSPETAGAGLNLEQAELWKQSSEALERIGIVIEDASACAWSVDECTEAAYWVKLVEEQGKKAPPPPKFIVPHLSENWKPKKRA